MKTIFNILALALLLLTISQASAQIVIDLRTGVQNGTGALLPVNSAVPYNSIDDSWTVSQPQLGTNPPIPSSYFPVAIGNGIQDPNAACYPLQSASSPHDLTGTVRWISPFVNSSGHHLDIGGVGTYFYKMSFQLPTCELDPTPCHPPKVKSAVIHFYYIGCDDYINGLFVNGNVVPFAINYGGIANTGIYSLNNAVVTIPEAYFNATGQNDLVLRLGNHTCGNPVAQSYTGLEIRGLLFLDLEAMTDQAGNKKMEFCVGEDIFLDAGNMKGLSYTAELFTSTGTTPLVPAQVVQGSPGLVNVTKLFENPPSNFMFQPDIFYKVKLTVNTACGVKEIIKEFKYMCCANSVDPSFKINAVNGGVLTGTGNGKGAHSWEIYSAENVHKGPYLPLSTANTKNFSYEPATGIWPCFFVKHEITNVCGTACDAQSICNIACDNGDCNLGTPTFPNLNHNTLEFTWNPVPGAVSYLIEITMDPYCCGPQPPMGPAPVVNYVTVPASTGLVQSHILDPLADLNLDYIPGFPPSFLPCFTWRVYAICADGTKSQPSISKCEAFPQ